jgi:UDP-3-O-[3-hydroxymyristoyl] glucosamine N-acyltransferase
VLAKAVFDGCCEKSGTWCNLTYLICTKILSALRIFGGALYMCPQLPPTLLIAKAAQITKQVMPCSTVAARFAWSRLVCILSGTLFCRSVAALLYSHHRPAATKRLTAMISTPRMKFSADQIASLLGGFVDGDPTVSVSSLSKIEEGVPGTLTFLSNPKYTPYIYSTGASVAIVAKDFSPEKQLPVTLTLIRVDDPYASFGKLLQTYNQLRMPKPGVAPNAHLSEGVSVGEGVHIGPLTYVGAQVTIGKGVIIYPGCFIGDHVRIGDDTVLYAGVRIYADCVIGARCTLHSGVVIGGDGFGFAPSSTDQYAKVPQIGNVILEDHVEVGANTTIDRATLGSTVIRKGVKLDNLIQVAHNVEIGENTVIAAQTGVAGSTRIGKNCMIGGQVGIVGHLVIADGVKIAAQSGIGHDITEPGMTVQGSPAFAVMDYRKAYVGFRKLPELMARIHALEKALESRGE